MEIHKEPRRRWARARTKEEIAGTIKGTATRLGLTVERYLKTKGWIARRRRLRCNERKQRKRQSAEVREREKKYARDHYLAKRDQYIAAAKRWAKANPKQRKIIAAVAESKRRARASGTSSKTSPEYRAFVRFVKEAEFIRCYWCNRKTAKANRQVDHIIPLAKGGADHVHNLCCSCVKCNGSKHAKLPEEFSGQFELQFVV